MCLGVPGKVLSVEESPLGIAMAKVSFGGIAREVCLAYVPEARVGDYVVVHAGFALSRLAADEAREVFALLAEIDAGEQTSPPGPLSASGEGE